MGYESEYLKRQLHYKNIIGQYYFKLDYSWMSLNRCRFINANWEDIVIKESEQRLTTQQFTDKYKLRLKLIAIPEELYD